MKIIYYILTILALSSHCNHINSQSVAINTRNSSSNHIWIIDGAGDNSTTPSSAEISNDIIINNQGNVGIGTHTPLAKLSIDAGTGYALQIRDGYQAKDKMLTSDDNGNATWSSVMPSTGSIEAIIALPSQLIELGNYTIPLSGSEFTVPSDGYYIYEIRWYGKYTVAATRQCMTTSHLRLTLDGTVVDEYEAYQDVTTDITDAITFFTSLATKASKGQKLALINRLGYNPGTGSKMQITNYGDSNPMTTKIIVKRLNMQ